MKKLIFILATMVAVYTTPAAFAESNFDTGPYFGGGGGIAKFKNWCDKGDESVSGNVTLTIDDCDDGSTFWKVFGGYQFNPYLAAELEYAFSSGYKAGGTFTSEGADVGEFSQENDFRTFGVSAVARYPFNDSFSVFGRGGFHFWQADVDKEQNFTGGGTYNYDRVIGTDSGSDLLFGAGLEFRPTNKLGVRLEHARYIVDDSDLDATTLQLVWYL